MSQIYINKKIIKIAREKFEKRLENKKLENALKLAEKPNKKYPTKMNPKYVSKYECDTIWPICT